MNRIIKGLFAAIWMLFVTLAVVYLNKSTEINYWVAGISFISGLVLLVCVMANEALVKGWLGAVLASVFAALQGNMISALLGGATQGRMGHLIELSFLIAIVILVVVTFLASLFRVENLKGFLYVLVGLTLLTFIAMIVSIFVGDGMFAYTVSIFAILLFTAWIVYDVQECIQNDFHVWSVAYALYLDALNIAVNLLNVFDD